MLLCGLQRWSSYRELTGAVSASRFSNFHSPVTHVSSPASCCRCTHHRRPRNPMDTGQDMQATRAAGVEPTTSLPRTAPRPLPHQSGSCQLLPPDATVRAHTCSAPVHQPPTTTAPLPPMDTGQDMQASRIRRRQPTASPPPAAPRRLPTLLPPCAPTPAVHQCTNHRPRRPRYPPMDTGQAATLD
jgi:hypothetical protein